MAHVAFDLGNFAEGVAVITLAVVHGADIAGLEIDLQNTTSRLGDVAADGADLVHAEVVDLAFIRGEAALSGALVGCHVNPHALGVPDSIINAQVSLLHRGQTAKGAMITKSFGRTAATYQPRRSRSARQREAQPQD